MSFETSNIGTVSGTFEIFDPEEMTEVVPKSQLENTQMSSGKFKGSWLHANLGKTVFATAAYNLPVLAKGMFPKDRVTIGFIPYSSGVSKFNGQGMLSDNLLVCPEHTEVHIRLGGNLSWSAFELKRDDLESLGCHIEKDIVRIYKLPPQAQIRVNMAFSEATVLLKQIQYRQPEIVDYPGAYNAIQERLSTVISSELQTLYSDSNCIRPSSMFQRYDLVRRAESFIDNNEQENISIAQLCEDLRTTVRRLELAFSDVHGLSPKKFIMMKKFNAARKELLHASPDKCSVSEVAMRHGFFHIGRFSTTYKMIFSESPSTTLFESRYRRLN